MTSEKKRIHPEELPRIDSSERFAHLGEASELTVGDVREWALADLRMNTARGLLVEYLVAKAVGDRSTARVEWAPFDVLSSDDIKIEVKTSAYSQSWFGAESTPGYGFKGVTANQSWSDEAGENIMVNPVDRLDVWVFALHEARHGQPYEPLNIDRWSFRIVPHVWLLDRGQESAGLGFFDIHGFEAVRWADLSRSIKNANAENNRLRAAYKAEPTVHGEMESILREQSDVISVQDLVDLVNERIGSKNEDGTMVKQSQIVARAKAYPEVFGLDKKKTKVHLRND